MTDSLAGSWLHLGQERLSTAKLFCRQRNYQVVFGRPAGSTLGMSVVFVVLLSTVIHLVVF